MIEARGLAADRGGVRVLRGVDLRVGAGEMLGIVGPNGAGKSTLLACLAGTLRPAAGRALLDGRDVARRSAVDVARRLAVLGQDDADAAGGSDLTVAELTALGRLPRLGLLARSGPEDALAVAAALQDAGVADLADRRLRHLSGGERQRAQLARVLAQCASEGTAHLLLDEPTNHLDVRHQHDLLARVAGPHRAVVAVLHDLQLAARHCTALLLLDRGRPAALGSPTDVLDPDLLTRVYGIAAHRAEVGGMTYLRFGGTARPVEH